MFQDAVSKASKKKSLPKLCFGRGNHPREFKIVFKCDVDGLPTMPTEITEAAEAIVIESEVFPYEHMLCV